MKMGREREVLSWDIHFSLLHEQIERVEAELSHLRRGSTVETASTRQRAEQLTAKLAELQRQLRSLGPSPRARMG
jgi:hypothetical protein